ncbi:nucleoporin GLE1 [Caerostris extrusa]|uniref:Nucleoporin GLE1 n=1 Tax=Caerostris extrusa TaxID=172846 RepID=A0AAV4R3S7_CAEEX|nr:nucleoporin GLE1 [Caerostris extrusa]
MKALLNKCHEEAQENFTKSIKKLASFEYSDHLQSSQKEQVDKMTKVLKKIAGYVEQAEHKDVTIDDILNANLCVKEVLDVYQEIVNDIENAKFKALKSHEKSPSADIVESSSPLKEQGNSDTISPEINKGESESEVMSEDVTDKSKNDKERELLSRFIAPDAIDEHLNIMENLKCIESNFVEPFKKIPG